jgi:predicted O-methyltransferase YrrM
MSRHLQVTDPLAVYIETVGTRLTDAERGLRAATTGHEGAGMQIGPDQGALLALLVRLLDARLCLEIGVFTGYSALAVAAALPPGGRLVACDIDADAPAVGRPFWREAGVADRIDLRIGPALATLDALLAEGAQGGFDLAFIDADKTNSDAYYERCLMLLRHGGVVMIDNVLWKGAVIDPADQSEDTRALRAFNAKLHDDARIDLCLLPIGDGVTLARKR